MLLHDFQWQTLWIWITNLSKLSEKTVYLHQRVVGGNADPEACVSVHGGWNDSPPTGVTISISHSHPESHCSTCCTTGFWTSDTSFRPDSEIHPLTSCVVQWYSIINLIQRLEQIIWQWNKFSANLNMSTVTWYHWQLFLTYSQILQKWK